MKAIMVKPPERGIKFSNFTEDESVTGQLKIRTLENGICGTDREIVAGLLGASSIPKGSSEMVLGHECVGVVEEDGDVFRKGDIVMPVNRRGCGQCVNCLLGRPDFCETGNFVEAGIKGMHGFMRESFMDQEKFLVKVPGTIMNFAIMAQPLSDLEKSVEEILTMQKRMRWNCNDGTFNCRKALVIGTGPIGTLTAILLRSYGFQVSVLNRRPANEREKRMFEITEVNYEDGGNDLINMWDSGKTYDLIIEASGSDAAFVGKSIHLLKNNGILGIFGFSSRGSAVLDHSAVQSIAYKSIAVVGLINGQKPHFERAMNRLAEWKSKWPGLVDEFITRSIPVNDEKEIRSALENKKSGEIKITIKW